MTYNSGWKWQRRRSVHGLEGTRGSTFRASRVQAHHLILLTQPNRSHPSNKKQFNPRLQHQSPPSNCGSQVRSKEKEHWTVLEGSTQPPASRLARRPKSRGCAVCSTGHRAAAPTGRSVSSPTAAPTVVYWRSMGNWRIPSHPERRRTCTRDRVGSHCGHPLLVCMTSELHGTG